ncbi:MAG: hypothetical protein FWD25_06320 [Clostridia bacterium]|nr:hypothetical protein [Clostridia bacterium]
MKKALVFFLLLCLLPMGWVSAETKPDSYAKAYNLFSDISAAMGNAYEETVGDHSDNLEYDDPNSLDLILFLPFLSIDMAFTSMLDEEAEDYVVQTVFSMFGMEDVAFTHPAPHQYLLAYTSIDEDQGKKEVEMLCQFSPASGAIRYSRRDNGVVMDFQELVPLGGDRYAMQNGSQRAIVTYANGRVTDFAFSSAGGQSLFGSGELVYDFDSDSIYPGPSGADETWVGEKADLQLRVRLDDSTLRVRGTDLFGAEKDVVIQR